MLMAAAPEGVEYLEYPHPDMMIEKLEPGSIVHVNHHAALHASWTAARVALLQAQDVKVIVTQHDTFETWDIMRERGLTDFTGADALVVHEPVEGIMDRGNVHLIWQGVLDLPGSKSERHEKPTLGLFGFDFPWKNFDLARKIAAEAGWEVMKFGPPESYHASEEVVRLLSRCWATAFLYQTGNSGTSAAIRFGLAARRPLVAFKCRQFRDLYDYPGIFWAEDEDDVAEFLELVRDDKDAREGMELAVETTADALDWEKVAARYKEIYTRVLKGEER